MVDVRALNSHTTLRPRSGALRRGTGRVLRVVTVVSTALMPALAGAEPWEITAEGQLDDTGRTAQKVELVDVDGDGWVDIVFANSKGEGVSGGASNRELNQLLINNQGTGFSDEPVFDEADNAWAIKAGDVDGDGDADLVVGDNYSGSMSYVLLNEGNKSFTREDIPFSANLSVGELELGDVDGDGDLDIMAADWGPLPHGQIDDPGGRLRLWLGNGDGTFTDGTSQIAMGAEVLAAWSFDLELLDINNDYALDAMISTRGDADPAVVLLGDGEGGFAVHPVPVLQPMNSKNINVAFTPIDFNGDGHIDVVSQQDGGLSQCVGDPPTCARRNSVLINDGKSQFAIPAAYWTPQYNPGKIDFDAATLDFNNDGRPDFVTTGLLLAPNDKNSRLFFNDGVQFETAPAPLDAAFPLVPELSHTVGLMFADFNHDRREDVAVAQRDGSLPNFALFGRADAMAGVPEDTTPPRIYEDAMFGEKLPGLLLFGESAGFMARVNDHKTPTHWHDYLYDTQLGGLKLTGDGAALIAHGRRLPYMEFALGLANKEDILTLADDDPKKYIAPSIWVGEALWRVGFEVPYAGQVPDTLTWQYCAIDAANNRTCVGPYQIMVDAPPTCGDGMVQPWEECDDASPTCVMCEQTCGDDVCGENEDCVICEEDCGECPSGTTEVDTDTGTISATEPTSTTAACVCGDMVCDEACGENFDTCSADCLCGNGICDPGETEQTCPVDCGGEATTDGQCDSASAGEDQCELDDDGCGCVTDSQGTRGLWTSLLLLGVFGVRRSRKRA
jgi:MYXO-CTERM domain-containing protein